MPKKKSLPENYENNPFFITSTGITLLFNMARGVGLFLLALSVIIFFYLYYPSQGSDAENWSQIQSETSSLSLSDWYITIGTIAILGLAFVMIASLFNGISAYTSLRLAKGEPVSFNEAFNAVFERLWSYIWLKIIISVKLLLWFLLFIIPGIIMSVRYSLADMAFFDDKKELHGNAAIKESLRLTKGAWLTTFSATSLFNMLTFGSITYVVTSSANAVLYRQFDKLGDKKPEAHWLAWLTLLLPVVLLAFLIAGILSLAIGLELLERVNYSE